MKHLITRASFLILFTSLPGLLHADPPVNDNFADAINLGSSVTATNTGTADEATVEIDEPLVRFDDFFFFSYGSTVWWKWTCPAGADRLVKVTTAGSQEDGYDPVTFEMISVPMDTLLAVFTGADLQNLTPLAEADDTVLDQTSEVSFVATAGTTYYIRIDSGNSYPFNTSVKINLTSEGSPTTAAAHVAWGKARMTYTGGWNPSISETTIPVLTANALSLAEGHFTAALVISKSDPEANLLLAMVNLAKLQKETAFQTLLTQLGVVDTSTDPQLPNYTIPTDPNGKEIYALGASSSQGIEYLKTVARPRLLASLAMLDKITSTTFLATLPDHMRLTDSLYVDYGDVLMLKGGCKVLLAMIDLMETYNLIAPLQDLSDMDSLGELDGQHLADAFGNLLKFTGTASDKRTSLKTNLQSAISLYNLASTHIRNNAKRPLARDTNHLFPLRENPEDEADFRVTLDKVNKCLGGTTITENGWSFSISKILAGTVSLRDLAPNFKGDKVIKNSVPKPDLAGALPGASLDKVQNFLRDEDELYEGLIHLGAQVTPGQESFGSISDQGGLFTVGTKHTFSATRAPGYVFAGWKFNNQTISILSPYEAPVIREYTLLAQFAEDNGDNDKDGLSNYDEVRLGTNDSNIDSDSDGWPDGLDAAPLTADARKFVVSQNFSGVSLNLPVGKVLSIAGQPAGVTYDAVNERLIGRPNFLGAGITAPKTFTIIATVKPTTGANYTLRLTFTVEPLKEKLYGTFNGLVQRGTLNGDLGGSLNVVVTNSGGVTGKLVMNGFTYTFPANARLDSMPSPFSQATCTLPSIKPTTASPIAFIRFTLDADTGYLSGTASPVAGTGGVGEIDLDGERLTIPGPTIVGTYNALLTQTNKPNDLAYPQGEGYATLKVVNTGVVTWTGKLADGTSFTGGSTIGSDGDVPLHFTLYTNRGSVQGWTRVSAGTLKTPMLEPLTWSKKNILTATRSYKDGFPVTLDVTLDGSLYSPAAALFSMLNLTTGIDNAVSSFSQGNLDSAFSKSFQIVAPSVVKPPAVSVTLNPNKVMLSIVPASGLFTGSFYIGTRKADVIGIIVPHLQRGGGYFLLPSTTPTATTSPIYSGKVLINKSL
ncbi:MAG: hypothetical protein ABL974_08770 [Prosthecobacter sp.]